ncbi:MAG: FemAB family protein [Microgenomates bacterium OLB23]|nr:MAG: FemAB family protein [Microgenomates bacterium OLB23]
MFVRVAPTLQRTSDHALMFSSLGYRQAPMFAQSELSWRLSLLPTTNELLAHMRKSTRYILKREASYGVSFDISNNPADFDRFFKLYTETVKHQEYVGHSRAFIEQEFTTFAASGCAQLYFAYTQNGDKKTDLAGAMVITQGASGFYHYGGSHKDNNIPAPHLLQWYIIKNLKEKGFSYYNFWGISDDDKPNHPWRGLTVFKKGFGGEELRYVKTQDLVLKPTYWLNWLIETLRRIKRGY